MNPTTAVLREGDHHQVLFIRALWDSKLGWWPVMGPRHGDPELNFTQHHWHLDHRFLEPSVYRRYGDHDCRRLFGYPVMLWAVCPLSVAPLSISEAGADVRNKQWTHLDNADLVDILRSFPEHEWMEWRDSEVYRSEFVESPQQGDLRSKLRPSHEGCRLDLDSPICPHKGADLSSIAPRDGVITCPLHGLRFCADTGQSLWKDVEMGGCSSR